MGQITSQYLWRMEQVLDIYERPYNPLKPVICFDERPCQLLGNIIQPIAMKPGHIERQDYHYKRHGTCVVLMAVEPLAGYPIVNVREQRTMLARCSIDPMILLRIRFTINYYAVTKVNELMT